MNDQLPLGFVYETELWVPGKGVVHRERFHNLMPQVSIDHIVGLIRGSGPSPISNWYLGIFENNYVPTSSVTASDIGSGVTECTAYNEANRPAWTHAYDGTAVIDNLDNRAVFTLNANKTVYGMFLSSVATKNANTGTLLSVARFNSPQSPVSGSELRVAAGITLIPTQVT